MGNRGEGMIIATICEECGSIVTDNSSKNPNEKIRDLIDLGGSIKCNDCLARDKTENDLEREGE